MEDSEYYTEPAVNLSLTENSLLKTDFFLKNRLCNQSST